MSLDTKIKLKALTAIVVDSSTLTGSFILKGSFPDATVYTKISNCSNQSVEISYDGTNINEGVPANGISPIGQVSTGGDIAALPKSTLIYMRGTAGTGNIYIITYKVVS